MINTIKPIAELKAWINEHIKSNHERGITGANLNTALIDTIDSLEDSSESKVADCVKYTSQTKTTAEKTIARQNIDANTFVAIIEVTPYEDIKAAFDAGRTIVAKTTDEPDDYYSLVGMYDGTFYFVQLEDDFYLYMYSVNPNDWTYTTTYLDTNSCVKYDSQSMGESAKAQARQNIGAQETLVAGAGISIAPDGKTISAVEGLGWELLIDNTTTEDIMFWRFAEGKDGQNFNNYREFYIKCICQKSTTSPINNFVSMSLTGGSCWTGSTFKIGATTDNHTTYSLTLLKRVADTFMITSIRSGNTGTITNNLTSTGYNATYYLTPLSANEDHASTEEFVINPNIVAFTIGSYVKAIGPDSRIVIYGKR